MSLSWLSLVPTFIVIGTMFITHQLNISLLIGIASAALIVKQGELIPALILCIQKLIDHFSDSDMIFLYCLLIVISSLIILLTTTGSAAGCAQIISRKIKTVRDGELSTILLAFMLSIDDYLSILTVGLVMSPMADRLGIVRNKLAYIIHALAGPLVIMIPISTWAAAVLVQLDTAGINQRQAAYILADSFHVYLKTIPFIFYSIFTVLTVNFVVLARVKLGKIGVAERAAMPTAIRDGFSQREKEHVLMELLPIVLLIMGVFFGVLYVGDYHFFGGKNSLVEAFRQNNKTFLILLMSSLIAFGASIIISVYRRMILVNQLPNVVCEGFNLIRSSIVMIVLASILGSFLRLDLETGNYIAYLLLGTTPLFLIPALLFIVSALVTIMTGSAWGTFSMLIPISVQMLISFLGLTLPISLAKIPMLFPVLGAVLSGAACGNHLSPFAETTFMTAASTGVTPLEHAKTQFIYAIPVLIGTVISYMLVGLINDYGLLNSFLLSGSIGFSIIILLLFLMSKIK